MYIIVEQQQQQQQEQPSTSAQQNEVHITPQGKNQLIINTVSYTHLTLPTNREV